MSLEHKLFEALKKGVMSLERKLRFWGFRGSPIENGIKIENKVLIKIENRDSHNS
jgi:hypothetical protein